jgi:hypothetical protein
MWYIHAMDYHLGIKRSEVPIHVTTWRKLENLRLSSRRKETSDKRPLLWPECPH